MNVLKVTATCNLDLQKLEDKKGSLFTLNPEEFVSPHSFQINSSNVDFTKLETSFQHFDESEFNLTVNLPNDLTLFTDSVKTYRGLVVLFYYLNKALAHVGNLGAEIKIQINRNTNLLIQPSNKIIQTNNLPLTELILQALNILDKHALNPFRIRFEELTISEI